MSARGRGRIRPGFGGMGRDWAGGIGPGKWAAIATGPGVRGSPCAVGDRAGGVECNATRGRSWRPVGDGAGGDPRAKKSPGLSRGRGCGDRLGGDQ